MCEMMHTNIGSGCQGYSMYEVLDENMNESLLDTASSNQNPPTEKVETLNELLKVRKNVFSRGVLNESLFLCCRNGNASFIPAFIEAGASFQDSDENGLTPLLLSALHGHTTCAQALIAAGADIEDLDNNLNTPIMLCALHGWASCARLLLAAGADLNATNFDGNTPLIVSSRRGASQDVAKLLICSKRVNLEHSNRRGYTALMCAIESANVNIVKMLIDAGAHLKKQTKVRSNNSSNIIWRWKDVADRKGILKLVTLFHLHKITGKSALLIAALNGDLNSVQLIATMEYSILNDTNDSFATVIIQFLKSFHEKKKMVSKLDIEILKEMLRCTKWTTLTLQDQGRVMEFAMSIANYTILKILADHNFYISCAAHSNVVLNPDVLEFLLKVINLDDKSQINYLLMKALECEQIVSSSILLQHGACLCVDAALRDAVQKNHVKTLEFIVQEYMNEAQGIIRTSNLLHTAVRNSAVDIVQILLDCGAEVDAVRDGDYPLTLAVDRSVIDALLCRCADPNVESGLTQYAYPLLKFVSKDFKTALVSRYQDAPMVDDSFLNNETLLIVKSLLRHGGHVDLKNALGQTALHIASERSNSADILNLLIASGISVNETDSSGGTALHVAVASNCLENIKCLINAGIDFEIYNRNGQTAIFNTRDPKIVELLLQGGANVNTLTMYGENTLLTQFLNDELDDADYIGVLIKAGINLNHRNADGDSALMIAANNFDEATLKLLVTSGADTNISTQGPKFKTVITKLLQILSLNFHRAKECISFCLDHGASVASLHPTVIHALISSGCLSLVPRFISFGLAPVHLTIHKKSNVWYKPEFTRSISPLVTALLLNQSDLAQYLIDIKYLVGSDISVLSGNTHFQEHLESKAITNSLEFLKTVSQQPMSLEILSFITISDTVGSAQDRSSKVSKLGLPQQIQDLLMFKNIIENYIKDARKRNVFLFLHSLKRYDSDDDDDDDDVDDEDNDEDDEDEENGFFNTDDDEV